MALSRRQLGFGILSVVIALLPISTIGYYVWKKTVPHWAENTVIDAFHIVYHRRQTLNNTYWL